MNAFESTINELLVDIFRDILKIESVMLVQNGDLDLSMNEIHLLESIAKTNRSGTTISEIAKDLGVTLPSVTIAVGKLVDKGFVEKTRGTDDGRTVLVALTRRGKIVDRLHQRFHRQMIEAICEELNKEEMASMQKALQNLNGFFKRSMASGRFENENEF